MSLLVIVYFFLVLHLLAIGSTTGDPSSCDFYARVAILLIIGQAVLLESVTTLLLRLLRGRSD